MTDVLMSIREKRVRRTYGQDRTEHLQKQGFLFFASIEIPSFEKNEKQRGAAGDERDMPMDMSRWN